VALTWGDVKQLIRLQAVARRVAAVAHEANRNTTPSLGERALGQVLDELADEVQGVLQDADRNLAEEFDRVVVDMTPGPWSVAVRASILTGWLEGAVEAETLEVRIRVGDARPRSRKTPSSAAAAD
jgi:hypothetical protein